MSTGTTLVDVLHGKIACQVKVRQRENKRLQVRRPTGVTVPATRASTTSLSSRESSPSRQERRRCVTCLESVCTTPESSVLVRWSILMCSPWSWLLANITVHLVSLTTRTLRLSTRRSLKLTKKLMSQSEATKSVESPKLPTLTEPDHKVGSQLQAKQTEASTLTSFYLIQPTFHSFWQTFFSLK